MSAASIMYPGQRVGLMATLTMMAVVVGTCGYLEKRQQPFGALVLCPVGGQSFMMAWSLACEVKKRRKRDLSTIRKRVDDVPNGYRPATLSEIMNICCQMGCEIRDLLPYCDPFGSFNS